MSLFIYHLIPERRSNACWKACLIQRGRRATKIHKRERAGNISCSFVWRRASCRLVVALSAQYIQGIHYTASVSECLAMALPPNRAYRACIAHGSRRRTSQVASDRRWAASLLPDLFPYHNNSILATGFDCSNLRTIDTQHAHDNGQ